MPILLGYHIHYTLHQHRLNGRVLLCPQDHDIIVCGEYSPIHTGGRHRIISITTANVYGMFDGLQVEVVAIYG